MNLQFTHPAYLWLLLPAGAWVIGWFLRSDVQIGPARRWLALSLRALVLCAAILAIAGLQWKRPLEGVNVFFALDRSDSVPSIQQEAAVRYVSQSAAQKKKEDRGGVLVFGSDASLESTANQIVKLDKVTAIVGVDRTDLAGAIRLATAAFPETGQKRLLLMTDGNENVGDALAAATAAKSLGVTIDAMSLGMDRGNDVAVQRLGLPARVKKGQTFDVRIFVQSDRPEAATVRLYRNEEALGEKRVELNAGKNLFLFPQTLTDPGFYSYTVYVEAAADRIPQNNRATGFTEVRGDPRILVVSADPQQDEPLVAALRSARLDTTVGPVQKLPATLPQLQSYDAIFISNVAAGDLGDESMKLLESAVRDFGVGLVCIGGDQTYAAGGYRGTPLEATLPVNMELDSKKVLPSGAVALVMHGMEFMNGNQIARDCALGVLEALGPQDEMGVVLWDGVEHWLFPLTRVGDKTALGKKIAGMNQGDLPTFEGVMGMAQSGLKKSTANLKHMIVFSDGDPVAPTQPLMNSIVADRITVSTVLIAGHAGPETMQYIANAGRGRFYNVNNAGQLPQIFLKEAAVILKSAIFEEPFKPRQLAGSELVRGIGANEYPTLRGYVCTTPKSRAEVPLVSDKGDPLLAHWQFGLGRAVAFTSDAKSKWATDWLGWNKYRQFWSQTAQWSLRRLENAAFTAEVAVDKGDGHVTVEALDPNGEYRNFLTLQSIVSGPKGEAQTIQLEQTGPGRYEAHFPTREVGSYFLNVLELKNGKIVGTQRAGASVNYSPEFTAVEPNVSLLKRIADVTGGRLLDPRNPVDNPFLHDRQKTFQPHDLWEWLLKLAVILFVMDVGVRRIQLDREEWLKATATLRRWILFWRPAPVAADQDQSLGALLARRDQIRSKETAPGVSPAPELFQPKSQPPAQKSSMAQPIPPATPEKPSPATTQPAPPTDTTSRLLAAKRRAQKKRE